MMQTAQMLLSELVDKVSKCSKNRLEMQMVGADVAVFRFMSPAEAGEGDMSFLTDPRYAEAMKATKAAAIVLRERDAKALFGEELPNRTMLLCDVFAALTTVCVLLLARVGRLHIAHLYILNALKSSIR